MSDFDISAPVGDKKRITKPDPKKKNEKFKPVSNKPEDITKVQIMLIANGFTVPVNGKLSGSLISAIKSFQKSACGFAKPDGIVDPGKRTWKAGLPKYKAKLAADQKAIANMVVVKEKGKEKYVDRKEFEREQARLKHAVLSKANMMLGQAETWLKFCQDAEKTMQGADGFMMSLVEFSVRVSNSSAEPPYGPLTDARSEASLLKVLVDRSAPDWTKVHKQDGKATKSYNKGVKAFQKFIDARIGTAGTIVGRLEVVREVSFTAVEAYATARFIAQGKSPAVAHAMAAAGTEALKTGAGEVGEYLAGNNVSWEKSGKKIFINTLFAGIAGGVGGKMGAAFKGKLHMKLSLKLAPYFKSPAAKKALNVVCNKIMDSGAMQDLVTNAAKETVGLFKKVVESGKVPSQKDFEDAVIKSVLGSALSLAPVKNMTKFSDGADDAVVTFINTKLAPSAMKKIQGDFVKRYGKDKMAEVLKKNPDFYTDLAGQLSDGVKNKAIEVYVMQGVDGARDNTPPAGMDKLGADALRRDAALRKQIEEMIEKELENRVKKK